jgi:SAM-dependent methyltransferase
VNEVRERLGAAESYRHLLERWLMQLATTGALRADGKFYVSDRPLAEPDLVACWAEAERMLADNQALLAYIRNCAALLRRVMTGTESPLETLFPGGTFEIADGLYRRSSTMRYINDLAASAVESIVAERGATPIRVLEVGAGTGGTTAAILPLLDAGRTTYRFTDVTSVFLDRAREDFAAYPFIEFGDFDLDRDVEPQSSFPGTWDLVIASNAVHATRDLRASLLRLRSLLAPGGVLILIESTVHLAWFDITTGLIEGWQHFSDDLRTDNPLISAPRWVQALRDADFADAGAWPLPGSAAAALGQHVIAARAPGSAADRGEIPATSDTPAPDPRAAHPVATVEQSTGFRSRLTDALPADRLDLLRDFVRERVVRILRLDPADPPARNARLMDLGFDSLMAVQLRNQLGTGLGLERPLPATLMFDYPTIDSLAENLLRRVMPKVRDAGASAAAPIAVPALGRDAIATMTEAEIEALLDGSGKP